MPFTSTRILIVVSLIVATGTFGCGHNREASARTNVIQAIAAVRGTYTWRSDINRYLYSDKSRLEEILLAGNRDEVVSLLVECLDDISPSQSTLDGNPVAVGIICHEALTQLIYYEPTAPNGDIAADWPGYILPQASPEQMREAQQAWKKAVEDKSFKYL